MTNTTVDQLWKLRSRFSLPPLIVHKDELLAKSDTFHYNHIPSSPPPVNGLFHHMTNHLLDQFEVVILEQCKQRFNRSIESYIQTDEWNFMGAVFFSMTVFTSIGKSYFLSMLILLFKGRRIKSKSMQRVRGRKFRIFYFLNIEYS